MANETIIQIIPANGWGAVMLIETQEPYYTIWPLACWALVEVEEEDGTLWRYVEGMVASDTVDLASDLAWFHQFTCMAEIDDELREYWRAMGLASKEKIESKRASSPESKQTLATPDN